MALYDPQEFPEVETKVSPDFSLIDVLEWARTKPADEAYDFCEAKHCAIARFIIETRGGKPSAWDWSDGTTDYPYDARLLRAAQCARRNGVPHNQVWTFGAFADRLEKALGR